SNGIEIKYLLPLLFKSKIHSYNEIIFIEFSAIDYGNYNGSFELRLLNNHKIKTYVFYSSFNGDKVKQFADILVQKKVAVKLDPFKY
ncbi:MAG: hypothetical protein ACXVP4_13990, partial [Bacteroidia bacterium]